MTKVTKNEFLEFLKAEGVSEVYLKKNSPQKVASSEDILSHESTSKKSKSKDSSSPRDQLLQLKAKAEKCNLCPNLVEGRNKVVFGAGNINADLVFVGEAPGRDEDLQGLPFVGRAGKLLTKMIEAIQLTRDDVFICNTLKCRPPNNRPPKPEEIKNCSPFLLKQLELIKPKVICALGTFAAQSLLQTDATISSLRGKIHFYQGIPFIASYHPAYLLRSPGAKKHSWEDLKKVRDIITGKLDPFKSAE